MSRPEIQRVQPLTGRRIRAVVYGVGAMGLIATRFATENGVEIVGAVSRSQSKVGRDLGELAGIGAIGVAVHPDAAFVLSTTRPDIVLHATTSYLPGIHDQLALCVEHGANVVTISEESLYPWSTSPESATQLHALAREHGVTITGSGHQDALWVTMIANLMGAAHRVHAVEARTRWNADEFGVEVLASRHVGMTPTEFEAATRGADRAPSFGQNVLAGLINASGLTVAEHRSSIQPVIAPTAVYSHALGRDIAEGLVIGMTEVDAITTLEGITFSFEMSGLIYSSGESDVNRWDIIGEPNLHLETTASPTDLTTCTQFVNRIPDVINAEPGFIPVTQLPPLRYRHKPFSFYVGASKLRHEQTAPVHA